MGTHGKRLIKYPGSGRFRRQRKADPILETDKEIRFRNFTGFLIAAIPIMVLFCVFHLWAGHYLLGILVIVTGISLCSGWMLLKKNINWMNTYRVNALFLGMLFLYLFHTGGVAGSMALWLFIYHLVVIFLLGAGEGLIWNSVVFLIIIWMFSGFADGSGTYAYPTEFKLRFALAYAVASAIALWFGFFRSQHLHDLEVEKDRARQYLDIADVIFLLIDNEQKVSMVNTKGCEILGCAEAEIIGRDWFEDFLPDSERAEAREYFKELVKGDYEKNAPYYENLIVTRTGEERLIEWHNSVLTNEDGQVAGILSSGTDVTERRMVEDSLRASEERYNTLFYQSNDMVFLYDTEGNMLDVNRKAVDMLGYERSELLALNISSLYPPDAESESRKAFETVRRDGFANYEITFLHESGTLIPCEVSSNLFQLAGKMVIQGLVRDIGDRKRSEEEIRLLAYYDSLTGLPNRTFYKELLNNALQYAQRYQKILAVMFLDIDGFKRINDTLGHTAGDKLLKMVGDRISNALRKSDHLARSSVVESGDVISRVGGDEFIVLLKDIARPEDAGVVAGRLLEKLAEPYDLSGHEIFVTASMGIALYPSDGEDDEVLLKNADVAMYDVKGKGKNDYRYYSRSMNESALERMSLESELRKALELDQLVLHYQPKVEVVTQKISGIEALVRWEHPDKGLVPPGDFIPIAEESGLIVPLGEWVLKEACLQVVRWQKEGCAPVCVSVNLSNRQFRQKNLLDKLKEILGNTGLDPRFLELEITESTLMEDPEAGISVLEAWSAMGIAMAIDDFGTGYSSLDYLKSMPVNALKIDRAFVKNIHLDPKDEAIAKAIVRLAHSFGLKVVAEGVETKEQLAFLKDLHCDEAQGYLFSRPLPAGEIAEFITRTGVATRSLPEPLSIDSWMD